MSSSRLNSTRLCMAFSRTKSRIKNTSVKARTNTRKKKNQPSFIKIDYTFLDKGRDIDFNVKSCINYSHQIGKKEII